jgi:hypothetical protein
MLHLHHNLGYLPVGTCEAYVYINSVNDIAALCAKLIEAIQSVAKRMLTCMWAELVYQLDVTRTTRGSNVEVN